MGSLNKAAYGPSWDAGTMGVRIAEIACEFWGIGDKINNHPSEGV